MYGVGIGEAKSQRGDWIEYKNYKMKKKTHTSSVRQETYSRSELITFAQNE